MASAATNFNYCTSGNTVHLHFSTNTTGNKLSTWTVQKYTGGTSGYTDIATGSFTSQLLILQHKHVSFTQTQGTTEIYRVKLYHTTPATYYSANFTVTVPKQNECSFITYTGNTRIYIPANKRLEWLVVAAGGGGGNSVNAGGDPCYIQGGGGVIVTGILDIITCK